DSVTISGEPNINRIAARMIMAATIAPRKAPLKNSASIQPSYLEGHDDEFDERGVGRDRDVACARVLPPVRIGEVEVRRVPRVDLVARDVAGAEEGAILHAADGDMVRDGVGVPNQDQVPRRAGHRDGVARYVAYRPRQI